MRSALIGREPDLALLRERMSLAAAGSGSVLLLAGEMGLGKTRLVAEVEQLCRHSRMLFLCGRGDPAQSGVAYGLFAGVLRDLARHATPHECEKLSAMIDRLAPHLRSAAYPENRELSGSPQVSDPVLRQSLFLARLTRLITAMSRQRPLVLCLEDLHLADSASLQLLRCLAGRCASHALLVLATFRPEEVRTAVAEEHGRQLSAVVWDLSSLAHFQLLRLQNLSRAQTRELMNSCLGRAEFDEGLVDLLHCRTRGIPLLVIEYLELLLQRGLLCECGGTWVNADIDGVKIPDSMRLSLQERLQDLSDEERTLLCHAAVQGERFEGTAVAETMDRDLLTTLRMVARLQRNTHLVEQCEGGFRFGHPLLAEMLCDLLPEMELRAVHGRLATYFRERLAYHLRGAGQWAGALPYLIASGRRAYANGACREARRFLNQALAAHEAIGEPAALSQRLEILLDLAVAEARLGLYKQSEEHCLAVLRHARRGPLVEGRARLQLAELRHRTGMWFEAVQLSREALEIFTAQDCGTEAGWARLRLAEIAIGRCRLAEAVAHLTDAQRSAHQDALLAAEIQRLFGVVAAVRGQSVEAVVRCSKALVCYRRLSNRVAMCRAIHELGTVHLAQDRWEPSLVCYQAAARLARELGTTDLLTRALVGQARAHSGGGNTDAASAACLAARALMSQTQDRTGLAACALAEAGIRRHRAQYAAAEELLLEWKPVLRGLENLLGVAECDRELGLLRRQRGDIEGTRQYLEASSRRFREIGALGEARKAHRLLSAISS